MIIFFGLSLEIVMAAILFKSYKSSYFIYFDCLGTASIITDLAYNFSKAQLDLN